MRLERLSGVHDIKTILEHAKASMTATEARFLTDYPNTTRAQREALREELWPLKRYEVVIEFCLASVARTAVAVGMSQGFDALAEMKDKLSFQSTTREFADVLDSIIDAIEIVANMRNEPGIHDFNISDKHQAERGQSLRLLNETYDISNIVLKEVSTAPEYLQLAMFYQSCLDETLEMKEPQIKRILSSKMFV
ncbi:hypothetical protein [Sulfitobacter sp. M22]|uniref:hypothetical protein n=1 Tax=Sulfitobacter sp. M22 TaxID=2675332 RepID=UPI001F1B50DE|nr:hypothetical protein [Sulfitobacter sp. M22]MCF7728678.1 hypothetical protein [Sulfitobacter sp. M22]